MLLALSNTEEQGRRQVYKQQLSVAIATALPSEDILAYLEDGPFSKFARVTKDRRLQDRKGVLAAAAAVGCLPALVSFVGKVRSLEDSSELYGTPLLAASANGQDVVAEFIFNHHQLRARGRHAGATLNVCMQKRSVALLAKLFKWFWEGKQMKPWNRLIKKNACIRWAIRNGNVDFLLQSAPNYGQVHVSQKERCGLGHADFLMACEYGHPRMLKCYLDNGTPRLCRHERGPSHLALGLELAAANGWFLASKLLLDNGADVNYMMHDHEGTWEPPVSWAVKARNVDLVVLLLACGATIPLHGTPGRTSIIIALAKDPDSVMARLIRQAIQQQGEVREGCYR